MFNYNLQNNLSVASCDCLLNACNTYNFLHDEIVMDKGSFATFKIAIQQIV